jgi:hypothetical protein
MKHAGSCLRGVIAAALVLLGSGPLLAQDGKSVALAAELATLMTQAKADSIAAQVPGSTDQFVGALFFPGSQLLVVTARYSVPVYLVEKLAKKSYQEIYIDLNSAFVPNTKVFISDLGANGLKSRRKDNEPYDTVEMKGKTTSFDGDWDKAKLSEKDYMTAYSTADEEYAKMLQALVAQLKKPS